MQAGFRQTMKNLNVLIVEDSVDDVLLLTHTLRKGDYEPNITCVLDRDAIIDALLQHQWDLVISDHNIPGLTSRTVLDLVQTYSPDTPFIIVSGEICDEIAIDAMNTGAHDYVMKDNLGRLLPVIDRALRDVETRRAHKKAKEVIQHLAYHDALTGLANRSEFESHISSLLSDLRALQQDHILMYIDLDQFKIVNDTCGHMAGDELLKQLSIELQLLLDEGVHLARIGGDEFGVLLQGCDKQQAEPLANNLLKMINNFRFVWEGKTFSVGASIGLVEFNGVSFRELNEILSAADMACYAAKDAGRNRVHIYSSEDQHMLQRRNEMQWVSRITDALEEGRLCLYRQKIVPIATGQYQRYNIEFLVRMFDEFGDLVSPSEFIPAAERYNLMHRIDRWVITEAFRQLQRLKHHIEPVDVVFINLSGQSLSDDHFFQFIREQVRASGIDPQQVCFEITETAAISDLATAVTFINDIKSEGFLFALDDFGAGLSSFSYLKSIPVDFLKLDGSFIRGILHDPMDSAIAESINHIGHVAGLKTIAEYVESEEILLHLLDLGFDFAQGFAIDIPVACEKPLETVKNQRNMAF